MLRIKDNKWGRFLTGLFLLGIASFFILRDNPIITSLFDRDEPLNGVSGTVQNTATESVSEESLPGLSDQPVALDVAENVSLYDKCQSMDDNYDRVLCLLPYFESVTMGQGAEAALNEAKELKKQDKISDCHLPAHAIGQTNFKKYGNNMAQAFVACPLGCFEGCFHGVIEGYADRSGNVDDLITATNIPEICTELGNDRKLKLHCTHGIGHGLMRHGEGQMMEKLEVCARLTDIDYRSGCSSGVVMENMNNYLLYNEAELRKAIPHICTPIKQSDNFKDLTWLCLQEIADGLMAYSGETANANKLCEVLPADEARQCKEGVAGSRHNPEDALHDVVK